MKPAHDPRFNTAVVFLLLTALVSVSFTGCTTLRRKFVRKSAVNEKKLAAEPILEPEEYTPAVHSPSADYAIQYNMFKGYISDLKDEVARHENDKRLQYLFVETSGRLQAMADILNDDKGAGIKQLAEKITILSKEIEKPQGIRRYDLLLSNVRRVERQLRAAYRPDMLFNRQGRISAAVEASPAPDLTAADKVDPAGNN